MEKFKHFLIIFYRYTVASIFWIYLIVSVVPSIFDLFGSTNISDIILELSTWFGSSFAAFTGAGLKGSFYGIKWQQIGVSILIIPSAYIAYWLSSMFSLTFVGFSFTGLQWVIIGFFIGLLFAPKDVALTTLFGKSENN